MFAEVKELLTFIEPEEESYDAQIIAEIKACALDLTRTAEIVLPGEIDITREKVQGKWVITDNSDITDDYVIKTIATWCNKEIGNPPNYENLLKAYESLKGSMRLSKHYTNYGDAEPAEEATTE